MNAWCIYEIDAVPLPNINIIDFCEAISEKFNVEYFCSVNAVTISIGSKDPDIIIVICDSSFDITELKKIRNRYLFAYLIIFTQVNRQIMEKAIKAQLRCLDFIDSRWSTADQFYAFNNCIKYISLQIN
ncbi:hypothetical protein C6Y11_07140 [Lactiplantibacillus pentosus]|uniref:hypothetical protein n=1 Tax=Lactiplantibacillus pentosus TaxID=1589 RepID=UPI000D019375|nr:hypothetical protein [Lactiplantibacillus pentosus]MCT3301687.1 hypothetical protein [Lactiplantibacillus pentosus]PRO80054.1 hypothetical protein C6Y11_07140 [Lactiplantibacillus pentosus]PRO82818.1 hypothetical protein C6Y09_02710 [Lactiplantibacillus pentosus]PRO92721.1 hypothetical protein C6Y12_04260 [Lactiplantibacillus pentosus]